MLGPCLLVRCSLFRIERRDGGRRGIARPTVKHIQRIINFDPLGTTNDLAVVTVNPNAVDKFRERVIDPCFRYPD